MKKSKLILLTAFLSLLFLQNLTAQNSRVVYDSDNLSGVLEIQKADFLAMNSYTWTIKIPTNVPVKINRSNSLYIDNIEIIIDGKTITNLSSGTATEHTETVYSPSGTVTVKMVPLSYQINTEKSVIASIKFARLNEENSETTVLKGDLELEKGILRAYGKLDFLGSKVSAILGSDYESYTLFGGSNGGRIRGSNEGYLILEANPAGYGAMPTIYMNRYVSNSKIILGSASGKVGIGIDAPMTQLHIGGAIRGHKTGGALEVSTQHGSLVLGAQSKTGANIETNLSKFIFNKNVDVKGTIRSTEVIIESVENFADFVFEDGYNLRSLKEVKQFISEKGHLPEIPSATEVKENGMSLVEMQVKLLQKIEELTLYVIDLTETIEIQKDKIDKLEGKMK